MTEAIVYFSLSVGALVFGSVLIVGLLVQK